MSKVDNREFLTIIYFIIYVLYVDVKSSWKLRDNYEISRQIDNYI